MDRGSTRPGGGRDHGCWWFSSIGADPEASGRFDLRPPYGTCYFASTQEAAARERVGTQLRRIAGRESVSRGALTTADGSVVVTEAAVHAARAANLPVKAAQRWVNRSLSSGTGIYAVTQAWASAFRAADFDGVVYEPRFAGGARVRSLAVFGPAGRPSQVPAIIQRHQLESVLIRYGVHVADPPPTRPAVLTPDTRPPPL